MELATTATVDVRKAGAVRIRAVGARESPEASTKLNGAGLAVREVAAKAVLKTKAMDATMSGENVAEGLGEPPSKGLDETDASEIVRGAVSLRTEAGGSKGPGTTPGAGYVSRQTLAEVETIDRDEDMVATGVKEAEERLHGIGMEKTRTPDRERGIKMEEVATGWVAVRRRGRGSAGDIQHITDQGGCVGHIV